MGTTIFTIFLIFNVLKITIKLLVRQRMCLCYFQKLFSILKISAETQVHQSIKGHAKTNDTYFCKQKNHWYTKKLVKSTANSKLVFKNRLLMKINSNSNLLVDNDLYAETIYQ